MTMGKKTRTRKARAAAKRLKREADLGKHGKSGEALASTTLSQPASDSTLRRIFDLSRGSLLSPQERKDLVLRIEERIATSGTTLRPERFGVRTWKQLAERFVKEFEEMKIKHKTFRAFSAKKRIEGYQSRVRGLLFHLYVRNLEPLQHDLLKLAIDQIEELNAPKLVKSLREQGGKPPVLINALNDPVPTTLRFNKMPFKAEKIYIIKTDGTRVEYIDDAFVSFSGTGKERHMSFLTETEVKTVSAAKGLSEQIASAQIRAGSKNTHSIIVVGRRVIKINKDGEIAFEETTTEVEIDPKRVVYSRRSINRSGVTLMNANRYGQIKAKSTVDLDEASAVYSSSDFKYRYTTKGRGESYLFIRLAVNTDELEKIVKAIWPFVPR